MTNLENLSIAELRQHFLSVGDCIFILPHVLLCNNSARLMWAGQHAKCVTGFSLIYPLPPDFIVKTTREDKSTESAFNGQAY